MTLTRRTLIRAAGGSSLALLGAGGVFAVTRTPQSALAAWEKINDKAPIDIRLHAFRHAILAPNPHNRQPWLIKLVGKDEAVITCDLGRRLPETDPYDRQILIGFGCFLELARIAAAERGFRMEIYSFPNGLPGERLDRRAIANLRFIEDTSTRKDPLYSTIAIRRTSKLPFDLNRAVDISTLNNLVACSSAEAQVNFNDKTKAILKTLRAQTWDAWMIELETRRTWMESVNLMRIGKTEIEANPDGISISGPILEGLALLGQVSREEIAKPGSSAYNTSVNRYRPIMASGMAYAWIVTDSNSRRDQLEAGRVYVRMNLEATRQGLGFHPVSQALQEYPEMAKSYDLIKATLGIKDHQRLQVLTRLGYTNKAAATPRWPLETRLLGA